MNQKTECIAVTLPQEMKNLPQWVCWKSEHKPDRSKQTKTPYNPVSGQYAKTNDSQTWNSFDTCYQAYQSGKYDGVGICVSETDNLTLIDIDHCVDEQGQLNDVANAILSHFNESTYAEFSPSGTGIHVYCFGKPARSGKGTSHKAVEIYAYPSNRYLTVTGHILPDYPQVVKNCQTALDALHDFFMSDKPFYSTFEKIKASQKAEDFSNLWEGTHTEYHSPSEADMALCNYLAFWFGKDTETIDKLFRYSKRYRDKWDKKHHADGSTYGQATVRKAVESTVEGQCYTPIVDSNKALSLTQEHDIEVVQPIPLVMAEEAFYGLAGEFVRLIEPHTEADRVALLMHFLTSFGHCAGRTFHYNVESKRHYGNLFVVIIGATSKARKGTSWNPVKVIFEKAEIKLNTSGGLVSGEGLIYQVRDEEYDFDVKKQIQVMVDSGVEDKRLLIIEEEFSSVLKVIQRQGNTLSDVLRKAWDGNETLRTLAKNSHNIANGAHISLIGHITQSEFKKELTEIESVNGFANRFLFFHVTRSKCLPLDSGIDMVDTGEIETGLRDAIKYAQTIGRVTWAEETKPLWVDIYPELSAGKEGLRGALTARAEAQAVRLATLYAVMNRSDKIRPEHLEAAMAVIGYSQATVESIFTEDSTGDDTVDRILSALKGKPEGLTQSEIFKEVFQGHKTAKEIQRALQLLTNSRKLEVIETKTLGRVKTTYKVRTA